MIGVDKSATTARRCFEVALPYACDIAAAGHGHGMWPTRLSMDSKTRGAFGSHGAQASGHLHAKHYAVAANWFIARRIAEMG
jgi:hypothetical protein